MSISYCDKCGKEFEISLRSSSITVKDKHLLVSYFVCPHCNTVYRVMVVEKARYDELVEDLEKAKKRMVKSKGVIYPENLRISVDRKAERLKRYVEAMNRKYPGRLLASENNKREEIVYIP